MAGYAAGSLSYYSEIVISKSDKNLFIPRDFIFLSSRTASDLVENSKKYTNSHGIPFFANFVRPIL
jgi:hypothetical protein